MSSAEGFVLVGCGSAIWAGDGRQGGKQFRKLFQNGAFSQLSHRIGRAQADQKYPLRDRGGEEAKREHPTFKVFSIGKTGQARRLTDRKTAPQGPRVNLKLSQRWSRRLQ
jgi:hypothetical protein